MKSAARKANPSEPLHLFREPNPPGAINLRETYRKALRRFWTLPPDAPRATYDVALDEVLLQEALLPPLEAQATHREEARRFHAQTGRCPLCQEPGELHLPPTGED